MPLPLLALLPLAKTIAGAAAPAAAKLIATKISKNEDVGEIAEKLVRGAADVAGIPVTDPELPAKLTAAVNDPAQLPQIRKSLEQIQLEILGKEIEDRQDARENDREVRRMNGGSNPDLRAVLYMTYALFAALGAAFIFVDVTSEARELLIMALGMLGGGVSAIIQFYFGSSASSRGKDIAKIRPPAPVLTPQPPAEPLKPIPAPVEPPAPNPPPAPVSEAQARQARFADKMKD